MRVIAGSARRLLLKTIEGMDTRPTTDRIKETLFNMLNTQIPGCTFLDLFSGSGAIGIEALSRGAKQAFFVESNPEAVSCIRENLSRTHLEEGALVLNCVHKKPAVRPVRPHLFPDLFFHPLPLSQFHLPGSVLFSPFP